MGTGMIFHRRIFHGRRFHRQISPQNVRHLSVESMQSTVEPLRLLLESGRAMTGLPWPVFIPLATCTVRLALTTPLAVRNRKRTQKQKELAPILSASVPIIKAQLASQVVGGMATLTPEQINVLAMKERRKRRIALYREFHCENWKLLMLPAVQIPVFVVMSFAVRSLVGFDLSATTDFGNADASQFWWFRNLVEPDPYGVLPLAIGACSLANIELNANGVGLKRDSHSIAAVAANLSRIGAVLFMANVLFNKFLSVDQSVEYPNLDARVIAEQE